MGVLEPVLALHVAPKHTDGTAAFQRECGAGEMLAQFAAWCRGLSEPAFERLQGAMYYEGVVQPQTVGYTCGTCGGDGSSAPGVGCECCDGRGSHAAPEDALYHFRCRAGRYAHGE